MSLQNSFMAGPNFSKGIKRIGRILNIIDDEEEREGKSDNSIPNGSKLLTTKLAEQPIQFHDVWFKYSNTSESPWILKGLNLTINSNESVGI